MNATVRSTGRVAAFFDLDGALVVRPSLERRFFRRLTHRRAMPMKNYFLWLMHAGRLAPRGIATIAHANKMYLRGVAAEEARTGAPTPAPIFFDDALDRVAWHAAQKHAIVLVSGTLVFLAHEAAIALALRLAVRGFAASIGVCATRLEEVGGRWTGRITGEAMFGEAKARAMRRLAAEEGFNLARCYAYGDSASDRWMLQAAGRPAAVNPSQDLERIARRHNWPVLSWRNERTPKAQSSQRNKTVRETPLEGLSN